MGGRNCCVISCRRRSHDHLGRKIPHGLTFHCFPAWRTHEGRQVYELTRRRRQAWVDAVGRSDITFHHISSSIRVCSRHFHSGKPAYEMLTSDPDWVPSLHMGHKDGTSRRPERLLQSVEKDKDQKKKSTKTKDQNQRRRKRPLQSVQEEQNQRRPAEMSPSHQTVSEAAGGKPAYEMLASDPDWVPSLHLGEGTSRRPERLLQSVEEDKDQNKKSTKTKDQNRRRRKRPLQSVQEEQNQRRPAEMSPSHETESAAAGGEERPAIRPWREVKSLLQSALQRQTNFNKQPVKKTDPYFRDFFRDALEASLEASSRSRALSARQPSSEKFSVELSFKLPPVKEEKQTCEESFSSSSCENCVKLQSRIMELQEKLSHLTGEQEDSFVFHKAPVQLGQELQSPETAHTEEIYPEWTEPLSSLPEGEDDPGMGSSKHKRRRPTRHFQKAWLKMFWFLRYSSTLDQMWCHVCRLHSDKSMHGKGLIRGSRVFKFHNIRNHSLSQNHKANVSRHMLYMCNLQM